MRGVPPWCGCSENGPVDAPRISTASPPQVMVLLLTKKFAHIEASAKFLQSEQSWRIWPSLKQDKTIATSGMRNRAHQIGRARWTRWAPQAQLPLSPPELGGILQSHLWRQLRTTSCLHCATLANLASRSSSRKLEVNRSKPNWSHSITTSSSMAMTGIRIRYMKVCNMEFSIGKPKAESLNPNPNTLRMMAATWSSSIC